MKLGLLNRYLSILGKNSLDSYSQLSKKSKNNDEVPFVKQVPVHPCSRLRKLAALNEKVLFIKQFPSHPRDRLKRKIKITVMKNINRQIEMAADNTNGLMLGEFNFRPKNILNKTLIFDTSKADEEIIMDRIIDAINDKTNEELFI